MYSPSAWTPQGVAKKHRNAVLLLVVAFALEVAAILTLVTVVLTTRSTGPLVAAALGLAVASLLVAFAFINHARSRVFATMSGVVDGALRGMHTPGGPGGPRGGPGSSSGPWPDPTWESWPGHHDGHHGHHHHDHGHHDHGWSGGWSDSGSSWSDSGSSSSSDSGSSSSSDSGSSSSSSSD